MMQRNYVTFVSPGIFFHEESVKSEFGLKDSYEVAPADEKIEAQDPLEELLAMMGAK